MTTFGELMKGIRAEKGLSLGQASTATGLHSTAIMRVEKDERDPKLATLVDLARGYGLKITIDGEGVDVDLTEGGSDGNG